MQRLLVHARSLATAYLRLPLPVKLLSGASLPVHFYVLSSSGAEPTSALDEPDCQ